MFATRTLEHDRKILEQGIKQGIEQGVYKKALETARRLKELKIDTKTIALSTGLSEDEIRKL